jgi:predicted porin
VIPQLELTAAWYGVHQSAYGTGSQAGCSGSAHSSCSGSLQASSIDADYRLNVRFDAYLGLMYSGVHDGLASGYLYRTNLNPTIGVRYRF